MPRVFGRGSRSQPAALVSDRDVRSGVPMRARGLRRSEAGCAQSDGYMSAIIANFTDWLRPVSRSALEFALRLAPRATSAIQRCPISIKRCPAASHYAGRLLLPNGAQADTLNPGNHNTRREVLGSGLDPLSGCRSQGMRGRAHLTIRAAHA